MYRKTPNTSVFKLIGRLSYPLASGSDTEGNLIPIFKLIIKLIDLIDNQADWQSEGLNDDYAGTFTAQPSKRALVADMGETAFVQYVTLSLNWTSNSTVLQFTMDYSMDGIQWNDYVEDERVKVRRNKTFKLLILSIPFTI